MYPVEEDIEYGDIVVTEVGAELVNTYDVTDGNIDWTKLKGKVTRLSKSTSAYQASVVGIVSDNYGDFSSTGHNIKEEDNPMPVALVGRVPVKISASSEDILPGDYITTSDEPGKATKATSAGQVIGKALEPWDGDADTVMVFIEQGYYNGAPSGIAGLTLFNNMIEFQEGVTFGSQVEFLLPPLFNKDTGGFAMIKEGDRRVEVVFENPYIAQPVVNATMSFEDTDDISDEDAEDLFTAEVQSIIVNKSQNGFTILINQNAPRDLRFSWTALAIKDANIFESVVEGLDFTPPASPETPPEETGGGDESGGGSTEEPPASDPEPTGGESGGASASDGGGATGEETPPEETPAPDESGGGSTEEPSAPDPEPSPEPTPEPAPESTP